MASLPKTTVKQLKNDLGALGAKLSGNKAELQQRLTNWKDHELNRTMFDLPSVPRIDASSFPLVTEWSHLEKLPRKLLEWITPTSIELYFLERLAQKGFEKGRRLFMCEFLKSCKFNKTNGDIFFVASCSAEMRTNIDYEIKVHVNIHECEIVKAQCQCPAGVGPTTACKHVSAVLFGIQFYIVTGNVRQNSSCTSLLQQWRKPKGAGRSLSKTTVNDMLGIQSVNIEPSEEVTDFYLHLFSEGMPGNK